MISRETARSAVLGALTLIAAGAGIYAVFLAYGMIANHSYNWKALLMFASIAIGAGIVWTEVRKEIHHSN
jgi:uncharacterized membrane protein